MDQKLVRTVDKTIEALARIERFIEKYGDKLDNESIVRVSRKVGELESTISILED